MKTQVQFEIPRSEQGQIVESSYGWVDGEYYRRTEDKSDRSVSWAKADEASRDRLADSSYEAGGENDAPRATWESCEAPVEE